MDTGFDTTKATEGTLSLLQIDDDANERFMVRRAIEATRTPFTFYGVDRIESAFPYFEHQPLPALVLLDYEMGRRTGVDFLVWLRVMKKITSIPVVMFTGSEAKKHLAECYSNGANYFLKKPKDPDRLKAIVQALYLSMTSLLRPGPIALLQEYQPDPRQRPIPD